ncbi:putative cytochrome P450 [Rosellinia necatrix]|uniref:Putative cytochrome P450 n=1 Tax=Rosellinia necatrix TaxID=77044 RepID=A0A1W2TG40_ROSNE|nr:putative cytochrome P450 [Rosellinia necatrix]
MTVLLGGYNLLWLVLICTPVIYQFLLRTPRIYRNGVPLRIPPNTLPMVGNGLLFLQDRKKLFSWFAKCERQFGRETFQIAVPTLHPGVVINDPANLDYVFKSEGMFSKGDFVKRRTWDLFGNGIINADGELWKAQRKAGSHFLNPANLRVLTDVALPRYLSQTVDQLKTQINEGQVVDLQLVFHEITSLLMGKMAYDMEMHADDEFTVAFEHASGAVTERFQNPLWSITEIFTGSRFRKSLAVVQKFGLGIVSNAIDGHQKVADPSSPADNSEESRLDKVSGSLIHSLLASLGSQQQLVADAALTYLTAGRDTTAQALTWCLYLLMRNQPVMRKVREEARELLETNGLDLQQLGNKGDASSAVFSPAFLPYTMAVFYETLRLYPPIPFEIRECERATTLPDGTFLPEKAIVVWSLWAMNRSKITWGEDADVFRPERWLTEEGKLITKGPSEFPVFYGGQRICLGKRMAEIIATQVIATMTSIFEFTPAYEGDRVSKISLTLPMRDGLPCRLVYRAS